jgi:hypothetical protein
LLLRLITGFVAILTRRVPLVEQEMPTLPENLSSPPVFSGVRVTRSLVLYVCFVDRCLSFCTFSFGHCVVCSSSIYGIRKSKKDRQHNGQIKKDKQRSTKHTHINKDRVTRTPLKPGVNSGAPEELTVPAPLVTPVVLI